MQMLENKKPNYNINDPQNKFKDPNNKAYRNTSLISLANWLIFSACNDSSQSKE